MTQRLLTSLLILAWPAVGAAHGGHGSTDPQSWAHYLNEPEHAMPVLLALAMGSVLMGYLVRRGSKR